LAIGFAILLAVVPFHAWVPAIGAEAPPLVAALIFSVGQVVVLGLLLDLMQAYSWLAGDQQLYNLMRLAGIAMVVLGGVLSFSRQSFGRLMGYAVLIDMGAVLLALGLATENGLLAALTTLLMRPIS